MSSEALEGERVTARVRRTADGEVINEYVAGGVAYPSLEALQADDVADTVAVGVGD